MRNTELLLGGWGGKQLLSPPSLYDWWTVFFLLTLNCSVRTKEKSLRPPLTGIERSLEWVKEILCLPLVFWLELIVRTPKLNSSTFWNQILLNLCDFTLFAQVLVILGIFLYFWFDFWFDIFDIFLVNIIINHHHHHSIFFSRSDKLVLLHVNLCPCFLIGFSVTFCNLRVWLIYYYLSV